jgi:hypothetical protein
MLRHAICAVLALLFSAGVLLAEFIEGKTKDVNTEKKTITVTVDSKDRTFKVDSKVTVYSVVAAKRFKLMKGGLKEVKEGDDVKLTRAPVSAEDKDPVVTEIHVTTAKKKKKDK